MAKRQHTLIQKFFQQSMITVDLFGRNELANHAAAGSYGLLLSAAPVLLIAAIVVSWFFNASPAAISVVISSLGSLGTGLDTEQVVSSYLKKPIAGLSAAVAFVSLVWTARIFALSIQRGLRVIFSATDRPSVIRENILTFVIEIAVVGYVLAYALSSRVAIHLVEQIGLDAKLPILGETMQMVSILLPILGLGLLTYLAYRGIPYPRPSRKASLTGTILCIGVYGVVSTCFRMLVNSSRYDLLYGTFGSLMVLLANVYFFFSFFYWGAQLVFVQDAFDALIFSRLRKTRDSDKGSRIERKLFASPEGLLKKYAQAYSDGEFLFQHGELGRDVYYVINGAIEIMLPAGEENQESFKSLALVEEGCFFGEMAYLLSEDRTASARARGNTLVLKLPPNLFDSILKTDSETARHVIGTLSNRLKKTNDRL